MTCLLASIFPILNESFGAGGREQVGVGGVGRTLRSPGGRLLHRDTRTETGDSAETRYGAEVRKMTFIRFNQSNPN